MNLDPAVREKLTNLVRSKPVVLFMKGNRQFPQCGFSAQVVKVLNQHVKDYATINVLADEDVRSGMKVFSDWPTFPQLYVGGEFVGGADIVTQMDASGDLAKLLSSATANG